MSLPNDIARCPGVGNDTEGWREGCDTCQRRTDRTKGDRIPHMTPPTIIVFECPWLIEPGERT